MSVIVKGMEMPSCCSECEMNYDSLGCSAILSDSIFDRPGFDMDTERLPNCPLRPLPKVHGDLIDRDATKGSIKPWSPEDERNACTFATVKKLLNTMLDHAPTIVEAEGD